MNQVKWDVIKQKMPRVNINIVGMNEQKWTRMGKFNSDDHYFYYCGRESLRRIGITFIVNQRVQNAVLGCNIINDTMILIPFQSKPFNNTVFQVYDTTTNAKEVEVDQVYEDLHLLEQILQ